MFTGIDEVDWASLRHAHGSARDVPGWLRALASADTAERTTALDGMYGALRHEGRVYDSTLACVPFLLSLAARAEVPDRAGIVELLVGIGTESTDGDTRAREAVSAGAEVFVPLAGDPDPAVRGAAAGALVHFLAEPARALGLLRQRLRAERDGRVLFALTEALGLFVRRHPAHADAAAALLAEQSAPPYDAGLRLAALGQLALAAPARLPAGLVPTAVELLRERSVDRARIAEPSGGDTLVGRIRRLRPSDEEGAQLLRTLHTALGDRVSDRIALLTGQLTSPDPVDRCNAVWMAASLLRGWRGDHTATVELLGGQLAAEQDPLRDAAVAALTELFALAAPAGGDLYTLVRARPDLWTHRWERGSPALGGPLKALARSGDPRAVPALARLLAGPAAPEELGFELAHLGAAAAPLAPAVRHRLGRIPLSSPAAARLAAPLLAAVRAVGDADAVPEVLRLLSDAPDGLRARDAIVEQAIGTLEALGATAHAVPILRALLPTRHAAAAAGALWSADGDTGAVLPVLLRELAQDDPARRCLAARRLGGLGPAARRALPALRRTAGAGRIRQRASAACALWRIDGDPEPVLPVFRSSWAEDPRSRGPIARCLTTMGPAASPLRDLVTAELAAPRRHLRHLTRPSGPGGSGGQGIPQDEALLSACREVLAGM
ncbi:HEAT repeat domain-containing protein [Streptomyces sp. FXJ1.172]|uniref:HEAT repeat domain-containing protein n=1 Tax=Streptomyces sp. FXJ1.172 TaxID=710705 RepID=UPI0007CFB171|nr:HEAT repeat domain-containing protein [Streptomyces sp. FXJ1.172]WEO98991.1 HEAT repeat domain-containing protein [Streptomyces sp. FXJ1.172]